MKMSGKGFVPGDAGPPKRTGGQGTGHLKNPHAFGKTPGMKEPSPVAKSSSFLKSPFGKGK